MSKSWLDVEKEYAKFIKQEELRNKALKTLNSVYGASNMKIIDDVYVDTDTVRKNMNKQWRILRVMDELEKNSFVKMFSDGWCSTCEFDTIKCAEQHECEAFKTVNKALNKGDDKDEETV